MRAILPVIALLLLGGCSEAEPAAKTLEPESESATAPPALSLLETCPLLPEVLSGEHWLLMAEEVEDLRSGGDVETQAALEKLPSITRELETAESGLEMLDARAAFRDEVSALADECSAAGSDALQ